MAGTPAAVAWPRDPHHLGSWRDPSAGPGSQGFRSILVMTPRDPCALHASTLSTCRGSLPTDFSCAPSQAGCKGDGMDLLGLARIHRRSLPALSEILLPVVRRSLCGPEAALWWTCKVLRRVGSLYPRPPQARANVHRHRMYSSPVSPCCCRGGGVCGSQLPLQLLPALRPPAPPLPDIMGPWMHWARTSVAGPPVLLLPCLPLRGRAPAVVPPRRKVPA